MATTSTPGPIRHDLFESRPYLVDTTVNSGYYNVGDMAYYTANNGFASFGSGLTSSLALFQNLTKRIGFCKDAWPMSGGISIAPITAGLYPFGLWQRNTTSGDTYNQLSQVTIGADAQTVQLSSNIAPAAPSTTAVNSGTGGTWAAAAHSVQYSWVIAGVGETLPSSATTVTTTSGQNIVITLTSGYLPAYVSGVNVYVDGLFAGFVSSTSAATLAGPLGASYAPRVLPVVSALTIGFVELLLSNGNTAPLSVSGGTGVTVNVRMTAPPLTGLI